MTSRARALDELQLGFGFDAPTGSLSLVEPEIGDELQQAQAELDAEDDADAERAADRLFGKLVGLGLQHVRRVVLTRNRSILVSVKGFELRIHEGFCDAPTEMQVQIVRWLLRHPNILALSPSLVHWFWKSREGLSEPDLQGVFTPASYREGYVGLLDKFPGMTCGVWQHRPFSIGHVRARSLDPFDNPIVQPNFLTDERDQQVLIGGMKIARRLLRSTPLAPYFAEEILPGPGVTTDDQLLDFARSFGASCYHVMGTARMGPASDPTAVVDDELRVRGIEGLRVADASIMPNMPSANICAATMMIAEKAADMIRGRAPAPAEAVAVKSASVSERHEVVA